MEGLLGQLLSSLPGALACGGPSIQLRGPSPKLTQSSQGKSAPRLPTQEEQETPLLPPGQQ